MLGRGSKPAWTKAVVIAVLALSLGGCALEGEETSPVYYVPLPPPPAPSASGSSPATASPGGTTGSETPSPSPTQNGFAPEWEKTCISILEFKDTYESTLIFSVTLLEDAARNAPSKEFKRDVLYLAGELEKSEQAFSYALLTDRGEVANEYSRNQCGEPLLLQYSLEPPTTSGN